MKKITTTLVFIYIISSAATAQVGMAASPMKLEFSPVAGSNQTNTFTVSNPTKEIVEANISFVDWNRDSAGEIVYYPANALPTSCTDWIKVFPATTFTLNPGEKKNFSVVLTAPPDGSASKVRNSMIFLTQLNTKPGTTSNGLAINLTVRMGIQVFYTPPGLSKKEIDINDFTETAAASGDTVNSKILTLVLQNKGELITDGKINFELTDLATGKKSDLPEMKFYSLPGAVRTVRLPLSRGLDAGKYSVSALVDYGEDQELKIAELEFTYNHAQ